MLRCRAKLTAWHDSGATMKRLFFLGLVSLSFLSVLADAQTLERRAFLGVQVSTLNEEQSQLTEQGLSIVRVFDNSTASRFGLEAGLHTGDRS